MSATKKLKKKRLVITLSIVTALILTTAGAILYAKGYRFNPQQGSIIKGTGLLSATSQPKSAQVYVNGKLTTATDDTINLPPDTYQIRIVKQGYIPWEKQLPIKVELVTTTNARLFPSIPSLTALTYTDAQNPTPSPNGQKLAYIVSHSKNPQNNGLYVLDLTSSLLPLKRQPTQIAASSEEFDFSQATLAWSPDSKQILAAFTEPDNTITSSFLLDADRKNQLSDTPDVTVQLPLIFTSWEQELTLQESQHLSNLPDFMINVATASAKNVYFSPDGEKMLYTATENLTIPDQLKEPLASTNPTPQQRDLETNQLYVYDLKEDTNFNLDPAPNPDSYPTDKILLLETPLTPTPQSEATSPSQPTQTTYNHLQEDRSLYQTLLAFKAHYSALFTHNPQWFPTSRHLITTTDDQIIIKEYDNKNPASVYSGPFDDSFIYPTPNSDRLILRTNLNQNDQPLNLYTLDLR